MLLIFPITKLPIYLILLVYDKNPAISFFSFFKELFGDLTLSSAPENSRFLWRSKCETVQCPMAQKLLMFWQRSRPAIAEANKSAAAPFVPSLSFSIHLCCCNFYLHAPGAVDVINRREEGRFAQRKKGP